jgi:hypothetical protein
MEDFITQNDVAEIFVIWLKAIDQNQAIQDACIVQLRIYLIRICTDILCLESNGQRSSWIWTALTHWDYLTYSLRVPSPDHWNLGDALDITTFTSNEPSRTEMITLYQNDLDREQVQYLQTTATIIQGRL